MRRQRILGFTAVAAFALLIGHGIAAAQAQGVPAAPDATAGVTIHYDWSTPVTSMRALNVIESVGYGSGASGASLVQSTSGQAFDGALLADYPLVMFMRNPATFTTTTFPATGSNLVYVCDLAPNTSYAISGAGTPSSATTDTAGVLTFAATGTGNITVSAGSSSSGTVLGGGLVLGGGVVIQ